MPEQTTQHSPQSGQQGNLTEERVVQIAREEAAKVADRAAERAAEKTRGYINRLVEEVLGSRPVGSVNLPPRNDGSHLGYGLFGPPGLFNPFVNPYVNQSSIQQVVTGAPTQTTERRTGEGASYSSERWVDLGGGVKVDLAKVSEYIMRSIAQAAEEARWREPGTGRRRREDVEEGEEGESHEREEVKPISLDEYIVLVENISKLPRGDLRNLQRTIKIGEGSSAVIERIDATGLVGLYVRDTEKNKEIPLGSIGGYRIRSVRKNTDDGKTEYIIELEGGKVVRADEHTEFKDGVIKRRANIAGVSVEAYEDDGKELYMLRNDKPSSGKYLIKLGGEWTLEELKDFINSLGAPQRSETYSNTAVRREPRRRPMKWILGDKKIGREFEINFGEDSFYYRIGKEEGLISDEDIQREMSRIYQKRPSISDEEMEEEIRKFVRKTVREKIKKATDVTLEVSYNGDETDVSLRINTYNTRVDGGSSRRRVTETRNGVGDREGRGIHIEEQPTEDYVRRVVTQAVDEAFRNYENSLRQQLGGVARTSDLEDRLQKFEERIKQSIASELGKLDRNRIGPDEYKNIIRSVVEEEIKKMRDDIEQKYQDVNDGVSDLSKRMDTFEEYVRNLADEIANEVYSRIEEGYGRENNGEKTMTHEKPQEREERGTVTTAEEENPEDINTTKNKRELFGKLKKKVRTFKRKRRERKDGEEIHYNIVHVGPEPANEKTARVGAYVSAVLNAEYTQDKDVAMRLAKAFGSMNEGLEVHVDESDPNNVLVEIVDPDNERVKHIYHVREENGRLVAYKVREVVDGEWRVVDDSKKGREALTDSKALPHYSSGDGIREAIEEKRNEEMLEQMVRKRKIRALPAPEYIEAKSRDDYMKICTRWLKEHYRAAFGVDVNTRYYKDTGMITVSWGTPSGRRVRVRYKVIQERDENGDMKYRLKIVERGTYKK